MPPQVNLQTFQRRQEKKKGGLGSILSAVTGVAAIPGVKDAVKAGVSGLAKGSEGIRKLDDSLSGAGKAFDTGQQIAQAAAGPALGAVGLAGGGGGAPAVANSTQALQGLKPAEQHQMFIKAEEAARQLDPIAQKRITPDLIKGHFALLEQNPDLIQANLQQPGLIAAPSGAPGIAPAFNGGGVPASRGFNLPRFGG